MNVGDLRAKLAHVPADYLVNVTLVIEGKGVDYSVNDIGVDNASDRFDLFVDLPEHE